jgi:hypothetical protein
MHPEGGTLAESLERPKALSPPEGGACACPRADRLLEEAHAVPEGTPLGTPEGEPNASKLPARPKANSPLKSQARPARRRLVTCLRVRNFPARGRLAPGSVFRQTEWTSPKRGPGRPEDRPMVAPRSNQCPSEEGRRRPQLKAASPGRASVRRCVQDVEPARRPLDMLCRSLLPEGSLSNRVGSAWLRRASPSTRPEGQVQPPLRVGSALPRRAPQSVCPEGQTRPPSHSPEELGQ